MRPMPREPPVTNAVRPARENRSWVCMGVSLRVSGGESAQLRAGHGAGVRPYTARRHVGDTATRPTKQIHRQQLAGGLLALAETGALQGPGARARIADAIDSVEHADAAADLRRV